MREFEEIKISERFQRDFKNKVDFEKLISKYEELGRKLKEFSKLDESLKCFK